MPIIHTNRTGVYCILNKVTGKRYIGCASRSFRGRWKEHIGSLNKGKHRNRFLQRAWNKYGAKAFAFTILELCEPEDCLDREKAWIESFDATNPRVGYNICKEGFSRLGTKASEETRRKISLTSRGRRPMLGHKQSEYAKQRLREVHKGNKYNLGRKASPETRAKLSAIRSGVNNHRFGRKLSAETRAKIAAAHRGRTASAEARANMSRAQMGRKHSPETIAKLKLARSRQYEAA